MTTPRRAQCVRCLRPAATCICGWIRPTPNEVDVLILQHPLEATQAKGSAKLLELSLARCETLVGETLDEALLHAHLARPAASGLTPVNVLLYPDEPPGGAPSRHDDVPSGDDAIDLHPARALRLVAIDGTWRKSLKMLHLHPALRALPRLSLADPGPSRYLIRKAPRPGQLSTLEAVCAALARLEADPGRYAPLRDAFDGFVQQQHGRMTRARG